MKVYGIKNCDTVKKALTWLNANNIEYEFHDFKKLGVTQEKLGEWSGKLVWESLLNKRGTTWKKLDPEIQNQAQQKEFALALMQEKTSIIKRPVLEFKQSLLIGFDEDLYKQKLL